MALELGAQLVTSLAPPAPRAACSAQASLWFVRPLVGHSARWVIRGSNQLPESRWPDPPVWIHFLFFSVRLPAADPPSRLGEQASLPPPASVPHSGAWSWQARKRLPGPPSLCLRRTRQSFRRAENLLSDPGDSPRPGSQVGSFRVGRSEGLDTRPTVPRCLWPRGHAAPQPAWSRGWCGPIRRGRAARGRGPHTVLRCALRSVWSPRPGVRASINHQTVESNGCIAGNTSLTRVLRIPFVVRVPGIPAVAESQRYLHVSAHDAPACGAAGQQHRGAALPGCPPGAQAGTCAGPCGQLCAGMLVHSSQRTGRGISADRVQPPKGQRPRVPRGAPAKSAAEAPRGPSGRERGRKQRCRCFSKGLLGTHFRRGLWSGPKASGDSWEPAHCRETDGKSLLTKSSETDGERAALPFSRKSRPRPQREEMQQGRGARLEGRCEALRGPACPGRVPGTGSLKVGTLEPRGARTT